MRNKHTQPVLLLYQLVYKRIAAFCVWPIIQSRAFRRRRPPVSPIPVRAVQ